MTAFRELVASRALVAIARGLIRGYQLAIAPILGPRCKYHPSCSSYTIEAIESFGILRGSVLAGWRLLRCNPWSLGGYDPVAAQRLFAPSPPTSPVASTDASDQ
jgi:uncharacterized protein